jgi:mannosyltransferase
MRPMKLATEAGARQDDPAPRQPQTEPRAPGTELSGRWMTVVAVGFGLVVLAGLVLRFWTRSALWLDEALTVNIARLPVHDIPAALKRDGAPPLYYLLLHFWIRAFGTSDVAVRSLSGVLSIATLPVAFVAARRYAGRHAAWIVTALLVSSPFAIYYATESRMYALVMFLTACGVVALDRALTRPRPGNLVAVAVVTAALLYSQYWSLYLVASLVVWLALLIWRGRLAWRANARWVMGALVVGIVAFVPWLPTFVYQSRHTGTPWAAPSNFSAIINAVTGFADNQATLSSAGSNQGRLLALFYFLLVFLALFGVARDRLHIELDLRTRKHGRGMAFVVFVTLAVAITGGIVTSSAFSPRYASVIYVPLLLLVGLGTLTLLDARIRTVVVTVAVVAGLALGVENIWTQRTQATPVAAVLAAHARPGDVVAFCPDQLGPAVDRLVAPGRYRLITFPRGTSPEFVNWVDYKQVARHSHPVDFAHQLQALAGPTHQIWLVWASGYQGFGTRCEALATALLTSPGYGGHTWINQKPASYYEPMSLTQFAPTGAAAPETSAAGP